MQPFVTVCNRVSARRNTSNALENSMKVMRTQLHPARQLIQPGHLVRRFDNATNFRDFDCVLLMQVGSFGLQRLHDESPLARLGATVVKAHVTQLRQTRRARRATVNARCLDSVNELVIEVSVALGHRSPARIIFNLEFGDLRGV
jgi:hypothetical protein